MNKICTRCKTEKPVEDFTATVKRGKPYVHCWCKNCKSEVERNYRKENAEEINSRWRGEAGKKKRIKQKESRALHYILNREKYLLASKLRYLSKKPEIVSQRRRRRQNNPLLRRCNAFRRSIWAATRRRGAKKHYSAEILLGCSSEEFIGHIQTQFKPGMTWDNYGSIWHIDHVIPVKIWDLSLPEHQLGCFNWRNHQPLFREENLRKHCSVGPDWRITANWLISCGVNCVRARFAEHMVKIKNT